MSEPVAPVTTAAEPMADAESPQQCRPCSPTPEDPASKPEHVAGQKRRLDDDAAAEPPGRRPLLTVDTGFSAPEVPLAVPRTPANTRSVQRTELHAAVCAKDVARATALCADGHSVDVEDEHGFTPLHNAAALAGAVGAQLATLLLEKRADVHRKDNEQYTCLHWASAINNIATVELLLAAGSRTAARSATGETPLHRAARFGRAECARKILAAAAAEGAAGVSAATTLNDAFESALDVAGVAEAAGGKPERLNRPARLAARRAMLEAEPNARTLVLHHPECALHVTGDNHQEHPERIDAILAKLGLGTKPSGSGGNGGSHRGSSGGGVYELPASEVIESSEFDPAPLEALRRVHAPAYVDIVASISKSNAEQAAGGVAASPVPFTPLVQKAAHNMPTRELKDGRFSDTRLSAGSYAAARRAAGAVIAAVDTVLAGKARNALCIVRPPGHHAGTRGLIPGSVSCGFCVFNSAMVAAAHALLPPLPPPAPAPAAADAAADAAPGWERTERTAERIPSAAAEAVRVGRVAVVDFDVHHGDGTEEIVRALTASGQLPRGALFFASIHLYDAGDVLFPQFYPGSGEKDLMASNVVNVPVAPLWRRIAPPPKAKAKAEGSSSNGSGSGGNGERRGSHDVSAGGGSPRNGVMGTGRAEWRAAFSQRVLPALRAFTPDLLLISAGFDGGCNDVGNGKQDSNEKLHQGLDLTPADFEWATAELLRVAAVCCPGRVVSLLEGGYGAYEFSKTSATGWTISRAQLGENAAAHASALVGVSRVHH